jgi:hypothetical protein
MRTGTRVKSRSGLGCSAFGRAMPGKSSTSVIAFKCTTVKRT